MGEETSILLTLSHNVTNMATVVLVTVFGLEGGVISHQ